MKAEVIKVYFDDNGIHKVGDIVNVENIDNSLVKPIEEKVTKKTSKE